MNTFDKGGQVHESSSRLQLRTRPYYWGRSSPAQLYNSSAIPPSPPSPLPTLPGLYTTDILGLNDSLLGRLIPSLPKTGILLFTFGIILPLYVAFLPPAAICEADAPNGCVLGIVWTLAIPIGTGRGRLYAGGGAGVAYPYD